MKRVSDPKLNFYKNKLYSNIETQFARKNKDIARACSVLDENSTSTQLPTALWQTNSDKISNKNQYS